MPYRRARLTRAETLSHFESLSELERAGIEIGMGEGLDEQLQSLDIFVPRGPTATVFGTSRGATVYEVWLSMVARRPTELRYLDMCTDFDDEIVLENRDIGGEFWHLGGKVYPERTLLNPLFSDDLRFSRPGKQFEGILLATGLAPIPAEFCHGQSVPLKLHFTESDGFRFTVEAELYVDHTARPQASARRPHERLFGPEGGSNGPQAYIPSLDDLRVRDIGRYSKLEYLRTLQEERAETVAAAQKPGESR